MAKRKPKLSIIGAGSVGSTLTLALYDQGYPVVSIISRTGQDAIALAKKVGCKKVSTALSDIDASAEFLLLSVSDDSLKQVVDHLAKMKHIPFKKLFAVHCSGVHSSDALAAFGKRGAAIASMHPIQTFPKTQRPEKLRSKLKEIFYGIEGNDAGVLRAEIIVKELNGKPLIIAKELKPLYHVACVFASNYLSTFLNTISELSTKLNLKASWTEVFGPLMTATMENVVRDSAGTALTGPIIRGDISTINLHLEALSRYAPQFLPLYTVSGIEVARVARKAGKIGQKDYDAIVSLFRSFIKSMPAKK